MNAVAAYIIERFPPSVFGPATLLLTAAALWASTAPLGVDSLLAWLLGLLMIAQFRVWDDLEDVDRDRTRHPQRVIVNAPPRPFHILVLLLASGAGLLCLRHPRALIALAALDIVFWLAYRHLRAVIPDGAWRNGVLLLKYPAFVAVISLTRGGVDVPRLLAAMMAAYASAYAYERWHDSAPSSQHRGRTDTLSQHQASALSQRRASARRDPRGASS